MNLLNSFSTTTGIKPSKSFIYERFYPLDFDKFIVLDSQSTNPLSHYIFWFRTIELIEPYLNDKGIKIVHFIEDKKYHYNHTYVDNSASIHHKNYILRNSLYFCGSSKLYSILASELGVRQCFLKADYALDNTLVKEDEVINCNYKRKNFFNPTGLPINNIRPEEIAKKILKDVLGIEVSFDNTIAVGKVFSAAMLELVPDCSFKTQNPKANEIVVRMDILHNESMLAEQLQLEPCSIVTSKPISQNIIKQLKRGIKKIFFLIEKGSDKSFVDLLDAEKINYDLMTTLEGEDLAKEKIKYLDCKKINNLTILDMSFLDGLDMSKVYFRSNKIVVKSGKTFPTKWHSRTGKSTPDVRNTKNPLPPFIDKSFKEEADHFYFLTSEQI